MGRKTQADAAKANMIHINQENLRAKGLIAKKKNRHGTKKKPEPPGEYAAKFVKAGHMRGTRDMSHEQLKRLLTLSVPPNQALQFQEIFDEVVIRGKVSKDGGPRISRTDVSDLSECYSRLLKDDNAKLEVMEVESLAVEKFDGAMSSFVFHAIVNRCTRTINRPKRENRDHKFQETVKMVECKNGGLLEEKHDKDFTTVILYCPRSSCFYCKYVVNPITGRFVACPSSWLRIRAATGEPARGSFIKKICGNVYRIPSMATKSQPVTTIRCKQMDDDDQSAEFLPPDVMGNLYDFRRRADSDMPLPERMKLFRSLLEKSPSNRKGGRRYVRCSRHVLIDPESTLVVDAEMEGSCDIVVHILNNRGERYTESLVSVRVVDDTQLLFEIQELGRKLLLGNRKGNCRQQNLDLGRMYSLGEVVNASGAKAMSAVGERNEAMKEVLKKMCHRAYERMCAIFPEVTMEIVNSNGN